MIDYQWDKPFFGHTDEDEETVAFVHRLPTDIRQDPGDPVTLRVVGDGAIDFTLEEEVALLSALTRHVRYLVMERRRALGPTVRRSAVGAVNGAAAVEVDYAAMKQAIENIPEPQLIFTDEEGDSFAIVDHQGAPPGRRFTVDTESDNGGVYLTPGDLLKLWQWLGDRLRGAQIAPPLLNVEAKELVQMRQIQLGAQPASHGSDTIAAEEPAPPWMTSAQVKELRKREAEAKGAPTKREWYENE